MRRLINPIAYRHLRGFAALHVTAGVAVTACGLICLAYSAYGWMALFLVIAALNLAGGYWYLSIDRSASART
jgi:hypothetical protein